MATIFSKIIQRQIPADIIYEDEHCLAFRDIKPQAPVHLLLIPKLVIAHLGEIQEDHAPLLGHLMTRVPLLARQEGLEKDGYRLVCNCKSYGGQEVYHLHFHILGGRPLKWPPG